MSFTNPNVSDTVSQRRSSGWGQSMAFPGPPQQTIEDSGDQARESNINVEGARIRMPDMNNAFNMSYNPSLNSPVFNFSNPSNTYFGLQIPYMQMQMQEMYQIFGSQLDADYEARIAALETWRATGSTACSGGTVVAMEDWYYDDVNEVIQKMRATLTIEEGLITSFDGSVDATSSCPGNTLNGSEAVSTCPPP